MESSEKPAAACFHCAHQVGKTYSLLKFGKACYENTAYFNFESSTI
jgi:hypothetical protein